MILANLIISIITVIIGIISTDFIKTKYKNNKNLVIKIPDDKEDNEVRQKDLKEVINQLKKDKSVVIQHIDEKNFEIKIRNLTPTGL